MELQNANATLLIRADANARMGVGHVMRCIALGQAWQDAGGMVIFVTCCDSVEIKQRLAGEEFQLEVLSRSYPQYEADIVRALEIIHEFDSKWMVVDGYHFDYEYQQTMRSSGVKLLYVDDYNHLPQYDADILLNQNMGAEEIGYQCNPECRKLLGSNYVMLRREFRQANPQGEAPQSIKNILISMGGSDPGNATLDVLTTLSLMPSNDALHVRAIVGPSNPHKEELVSYLESVDLPVELLESVKDMPSLIQWADFAVTAAGSTCWELLALRVPFVTVILAENQERVADQLMDRAHIECAGRAGSGLFERLLPLLVQSLKAKPDSRAGVSVIDQFGVDRILRKPSIDCGLNLFSNRLALRCVLDEDVTLLLEWANDPVTRSNSFNSEPISVESHLSWFKKRVSNPDVCMFILEVDGVPCGHIRYELDEIGDALLSFVVSPVFRGMGIGKRLVKMSCAIIADRWCGCRIKALTLSENKASSCVFEATGFAQQEVMWVQGKKCNLFCYGV